jgi:glycosyltransferase involved in cell wall biosynthesis
MSASMRRHWFRALAEAARNYKPFALADGIRAIGRSKLATMPKEKLEYVALAARRFAFAERPKLIAKWCARHFDLREPDQWRNLRVGWKRYGPEFGDILVDRDLRTSLILKAPTDDERGVLYMSFEYNLMRLVASGFFQAIQRHYWLVCATSWSPTDFSIVGNALAADGSPLFLGISHDADIANFEALTPRVVALPLLASDWLRASGYRPRPRPERDLDIVMVANWTVFKRHWLLFEALKRMPKDLRVVLIGRDGDGRTAATIRREAEELGGAQEFECFTDIPHKDVRDLLCRARVSPILSFREGSCVAVTEAMFSDTPVVMMKDGHVGTSRYISNETGRFATRDTLAEMLMGYIRGDTPCSPRAAILTKANAEGSSALLNAALRHEASKRHEPWRKDIAPLCWDGKPRYLNLDDEARLEPAYEDFERRYGIKVHAWRAELAS